jgi:leucyl/phenylalanyl-tRNA---protein transferase
MTRKAPDVQIAISAYAQGLFPMDDPDGQHEPLPFYRADPRAILPLDDASLERLRRRIRRSTAADPGWTADVDRDFPATLAGCARPRPGDGVWLTPRMEDLYRRLHAVGLAHSFELWDGDELLAGVLGVVLARAAMLESMFHTRSHAGNINLLRTLERLAAAGIELCDIQLSTPHTLRLGAVEIPAAEYERRLAAALGV